MCLFCLWHAVVLLCCCFFFCGWCLAHLLCCTRQGGKERSWLFPLILSFAPFLSHTHSLSLIHSHSHSHSLVASAQTCLCVSSLLSLHTHTRLQPCCAVAGRSFDLWMGVCLREDSQRRSTHFSLSASVLFLLPLLCLSFFFVASGRIPPSGLCTTLALPAAARAANERQRNT